VSDADDLEEINKLVMGERSEVALKRGVQK